MLLLLAAGCGQAMPPPGGRPSVPRAPDAGVSSTSDGGAGDSGEPVAGQDGGGSTAAPGGNDAAPPPEVVPPSPYPDSILCPPAPSPRAGALSGGFASQCAGCHGRNGEGRPPFPSLRNRMDAAAFLLTVRQGRKGMPPFDEADAPEARLRSDFAALQGLADPTGAAGDPDCGPGLRELPPSTAESRAARIAHGLVAYRKPGPKGACAGCHSAAAIDLAFIGFSDADILRRAIPQVGVDDARAVLDLVHALREQHRIDRPLHPRRFRFLQPGHEVLPELRQPLVYPGDDQPVGVHDAARDAAFARSLVDDVKLRLTGEPIRSLAEARAAETQLRQLDLRRLPVGVPFQRWTEDGFHGPGSNVPTEWVAMLARRPAPGGEARWQSLVDSYLADPSTANLWRMYDAIETATTGEDAAPLAARWSLRKYQAVQLASHMLLHRTLDIPDWYHGAPAGDPAARRQLAIARNPFWRVGDSVRQNPLNCNQPDPCTTFPPALDATINPGDAARERQSYEEKMAWFWMGFTLDPALVVTEDSLATVSGDYFLALSQPWYQVHNAFIVAAIVTAKANARDYQNITGVALPGHGRWASPRPFMAFKHSERELHHPPPNDLRFPIHARLWANSFRMFLYLMNDELERTHEVFDRKRTLDAVSYMHQWFGPGRPLATVPDNDHSDLDALVPSLRQRLVTAVEVGVVQGY
jgi:mono/diheme cytochrome c family protein